MATEREKHYEEPDKRDEQRAGRKFLKSPKFHSGLLYNKVESPTNSLIQITEKIFLKLSKFQFSVLYNKIVLLTQHKPFC